MQCLRPHEIQSGVSEDSKHFLFEQESHYMEVRGGDSKYALPVTVETRPKPVCHDGNLLRLS